MTQRRPNAERARSFEKESLLEDTLAQQNEDIDEIAGMVSGINEHAKAIGAEVDGQNVCVAAGIVLERRGGRRRGMDEAVGDRRCMW